MQVLLSSALRRAERLFGRQEATVCQELRLTYAQVGSRCRQLAAGLRRIGIRHGDRVAVMMTNCHRFLEAYYAIPSLGAIIVPLNTRHALTELRAILDDCDPRLVIVGETFAAVAQQLATAGYQVLVAPEDYERIVASSPELDDSGDPVDEHDLAALFYTGGTTGTAKGVMLSHRNLVTNAFHMTIGAAYDANDTFLHAAPMFHLADGSSIYALVWRGARHVFLPVFDPGQVLDLIARERVTCTILVPMMLSALVQRPDLATSNLSSLRLVLHGGAPIAGQLLRRAIAGLGCSLTQAYGLTESSALASMLQREEQLVGGAAGDHPRLRSAGQAVMGVELSVRRPDGDACAVGEVGEVALRGPNVMRGYWNKPEQTAEALHDGWFWTGDLAYLDEEDYVYLVDRKKDMIVSGGENVYSAEVEDVLCTHQAVLEAAVIGVPDEIWGERVHAIVVTRPAQAVEPEALRAFCRQYIAGYKTPRSIEFVPALPKSGAGKVLKRELRAAYWVGQARQVH